MQDPIDELVQAMAHVVENRIKLLRLVRDYRQLLDLWDNGSMDEEEEYCRLHQSVRNRTRELLGE